MNMTLQQYYPGIMNAMSVVDALLLLVIGAVIALDFIRGGDDAPRDQLFKRFLPAALFFVGFNMLALVLLRIGQWLATGGV